MTVMLRRRLLGVRAAVVSPTAGDFGSLQVLVEMVPGKPRRVAGLVWRWRSVGHWCWKLASLRSIKVLAEMGSLGSCGQTLISTSTAPLWKLTELFSGSGWIRQPLGTWTVKRPSGLA
jgi:hypothetical protein